jgi:RNA polymerase sigma-70 factor (ECF subfamily)
MNLFVVVVTLSTIYPHYDPSGSFKVGWFRFVFHLGACESFFLCQLGKNILNFLKTKHQYRLKATKLEGEPLMIQQDWIERIKQGDREAFRLLYEQSVDHVFRTVSFLIRDKQDASDVVHEVYVEMIKSLRNYDTSKPFRAWLNGLVIRQTSNWNRKLWRRSRLNERGRQMEVAENVPNLEHIHLQNEQSNELLSLVHKLSYKHSIVIVLRYYEECSFEEISRILQIPLGTVKSRHRMALERMRRKGNYRMKKRWNSGEENILNPTRLQFLDAAARIARPQQLDVRIEQMMHYQIKDENETIRVVAGLPSELQLNSSSVNRLTEVGTEVRDQLAPGQAVFLYISDLDGISDQGVLPHSFLRICNPLTYSDMDEWRGLICDDYKDILIPMLLPSGYSFTYAVVQSRVGHSQENKEKHYDLLKRQAITTKQKVTWRVVEPEDFSFLHVAPAIVYMNDNGEQIKLSYMIMKNGTFRTILPKAVKVRVAELDVDVYWTNYGTNCATWIKRRNGKTHHYEISAPLSVSRESLMQMIANMD